MGSRERAFGSFRIVRYRERRWDTCALLLPAFVREWRGFLMPRGGAPMTVTTHIGEDGSVSVTVCDTGEDDDQPRPLSSLALEDLARHSATTAISAWVTLHDGNDCDDTA